MCTFLCVFKCVCVCVIGGGILPLHCVDRWLHLFFFFSSHPITEWKLISRFRRDLWTLGSGISIPPSTHTHAEIRSLRLQCLSCHRGQPPPPLTPPCNNLLSQHRQSWQTASVMGLADTCVWQRFVTVSLLHWIWIILQVVPHPGNTHTYHGTLTLQGIKGRSYRKGQWEGCCQVWGKMAHGMFKLVIEIVRERKKGFKKVDQRKIIET